MIVVDAKSGGIQCENETELRAVLNVTGHGMRNTNGRATSATMAPPSKTGKGKRGKKRGRRSPEHTAAIEKAAKEITALADKHDITRAEAAQWRKEIAAGVRTATGRISKRAK